MQICNTGWLLVTTSLLLLQPHISLLEVIVFSFVWRRHESFWNMCPHPESEGRYFSAEQQSLCWVFQIVFLVTSSEMLHYSCDGLQCRCTTCISRDVLKNCNSRVNFLSCSERIRWDVRIYHQGSCCHCPWMETAGALLIVLILT